jgi:type I restriction enzyme S subunit
MKSNYRKIGDLIQLVDERNKELKVTTLLGLSISKQFIPSVANTVGTNMRNYKIIRKNQFACSIMQVRRDKKIPVALLKDFDEAIISQAYPVFEVKDEKEILPDYLMMWMSRSEFDRHACFLAVGGVRGSLEWEDFCNMELPVPSIEKQRAIVREYNTIVRRIQLNQQLNQKLEETAQALYRHWFVDFVEEQQFDDQMAKLEEYVELNPKLRIEKGTDTFYVGMADLQTDSLSIETIIKRAYTSGAKFQNNDTLLARITPCLENGKTAFVDCLPENEVAFGSTEFIVMRSKLGISPYWVYCLARDEDFRSYAISSMVGSSGRQRVNSDYLNEYILPKIDSNLMSEFNRKVTPLFSLIKLKSREIKLLKSFKEILLSKLTNIELSKPSVIS